MTELELQQYLLREYPQENARCEWKEFKNLKNSFCGDEKDDVISYVSAIARLITNVCKTDSPRFLIRQTQATSAIWQTSVGRFAACICSWAFLTKTLPPHIPSVDPRTTTCVLCVDSNQQATGKAAYGLTSNSISTMFQCRHGRWWSPATSP